MFLFFIESITDYFVYVKDRLTSKAVGLVGSSTRRLDKNSQGPSFFDLQRQASIALTQVDPAA